MRWPPPLTFIHAPQGKSRHVLIYTVKCFPSSLHIATIHLLFIFLSLGNWWKCILSASSVFGCLYKYLPSFVQQGTQQCRFTAAICTGSQYRLVSIDLHTWYCLHLCLVNLAFRPASFFMHKYWEERIRHPIDTQMVSLESHASTHQLMVLGNIPTSTRNWSQN